MDGRIVELEIHVHLARRSAIVLGLAALLCACDDGMTRPAPTAPTARLRFLHAHPVASTVTVRWSGQIVFSGAAYQAVQPYRDVPVGQAWLTVQVTNVIGQYLAAKTFTLAERQDYTALLISPLPGTLGVGGEAALVADTNTAPAAGKSRLRVLNAASGIGNRDVYVTLPGADLAPIAPAVSGLSPAGPSNYLELEPGTYDVRLTTVGTKNVVIIGGNVTLAAGQVRTFVVLPTRTGGFMTAILPDRDP